MPRILAKQILWNGGIPRFSSFLVRRRRGLEKLWPCHGGHTSYCQEKITTYVLWAWYSSVLTHDKEIHAECFYKYRHYFMALLYRTYRKGRPSMVIFITRVKASQLGPQVPHTTWKVASARSNVLYYRELLYPVQRLLEIRVKVFWNVQHDKPKCDKNRNRCSWKLLWSTSRLRCTH